MSAKSTVAITVIALAAGAALGMLLAPASGRETRKKLVKKAGSIRDSLEYSVLQAKDVLDKLKGQAEEAADVVKDQAKSAVKEAARARHHQTSTPNNV